MALRILRLLLLLGVILGVVLPKTSAALADLGVVHAGSVLICTGHGLERITLNPDEAPAPTHASHDEAPCLLVHALDSAEGPSLPVWVRLARDFHPAATTDLCSGVTCSPTRFARAPPRA